MCSGSSVLLSSEWARLVPVLIMILGGLMGCDKPSRSMPIPAKTNPYLDPDGERTESAGADVKAVRDDDWFEDVTNQAGVRFQYSSGRDAGRFTLLETLGGGLGLFDFDRDGDLDLFIPGGGTISATTGETQGRPSALYRNDGDFRFVDVTKQVGLDVAIDYSHGCAVGDIDRDGYPDLFVTCYGRSRLFRNVEGQRFADVSDSAGIKAQSWDTAAVLVDLTGDGFPELYVAAYVNLDTRKEKPCPIPNTGKPDVCPPQRYAPVRDRLYQNRGDGTFEEITEKAGLLKEGRGLGVLAADVNDDGRPDLYVANDGDPNHLYLGGTSWPLREVGLPSGTAVNEKGAAEGSMGVDFADINGDSRSDLWVVNFELEDNSLYLNLGDGQFEHASTRFGLAGTCRAYVKFGTSLHDFDGDGWPDIHVMNGHVLYHGGQSDFLQPPFLYRNAQGRRFSDVSEKGGTFFRQKHAARGTAVGDLNDDGALDLVVSRLDAPVCILKNRKPPKAWVGAILEPHTGDSQGVGVTVTVSNGKRDVAWPVRLGTSFVSHSESRPMFALEESPQRTAVSVRWASGKQETFADLETNRIHHLREGGAE